MVYMHFPTHLTEEEEMLQRKYALLKKKKRILQALRVQKQEPKQETEKPAKRSSEEAANATEQAKKLLKSGAIKVEMTKKDGSSFKRTKRKEMEKSAVGFQPFSQAHTSDTEEEKDKPEASASGSGSRPKMKNLYDSFVSSRDPHEPREPREKEPREPRESKEREPRVHSREREETFKRRPRPHRDIEMDKEPPKRGQTIYVHGLNITEDLLHKAFSHFGTIVNVSMENDRNCGFVTFEKMESSDQAIREMNGSIVSDVQLRVSMARNQPTFHEHNTDASTVSWSSIAASHSQKGGHQDKRDLVAYDEDFF